MSLALLQRLFGHSSHLTTHRYAHLQADPMRAEADGIAASIAAALKLGARKPAGERGRSALKRRPLQGIRRAKATCSPGPGDITGSLVPLLRECREAIRACRSRVEIMLVALNNLMPYGAADCDQPL